jgi:hypothetical protein
VCRRNAGPAFKGYQDEILNYYVRVGMKDLDNTEQQILWRMALARSERFKPGEDRVVAALAYLKELPEEEIEKVRMLIASGAL